MSALGRFWPFAIEAIEWPLLRPMQPSRIQDYSSIRKQKELDDVSITQLQTPAGDVE